MWGKQSVWFNVALVMRIFAVGKILFGHSEERQTKARGLLKVALVAGLVVALSQVGLRWVGYVVNGMLGLAAAYIHICWLPRQGMNGWTGEPKVR